MPYIDPDRRKDFKPVMRAVAKCNIANKGELEYLVFNLMKHYMSDWGRDYRYLDLHDVVYAIQHCADEFRRRFLDAREDEAREENGDIE